jgi:hypothetical protein
VKIGEETSPIVTIAWARFYLARLDSSIAVPKVGISDAPGVLPAFLKFPWLDLPASDMLPWGRQGFATSFEQARSLFNASLPKLREALEFYKLDGWVTDHVEVLFDVSKAYSCVFLLRCGSHFPSYPQIVRVVDVYQACECCLWQSIWSPHTRRLHIMQCACMQVSCDV